MAAILIQEQTTDLTFVWQKLNRTIQIYTERYPELMYVTAGMKKIKQNGHSSEDAYFLNYLNNYMKENLSEYYVIKILRHNLQSDIQALLADKEVDRKKELYLNFL